MYSVIKKKLIIVHHTILGLMLSILYTNIAFET